MNIARVLLGWQSPTHVCQLFTRQIRVYQHKKVGEKVGENRDKFYLPTCLATVFVPFTHQLESANTEHCPIHPHCIDPFKSYSVCSIHVDG